MTVEEKMRMNHKEMVDGISAFSAFLVKQVTKKDDIPDVILASSCRKMVEDWLGTELKDDGNSKKN